MSGDLSRDDLFLLLQSYENTVKSNQTLLEQQKRIIENHTELLKQQQDVITNTNEILRKAETFDEDLSSHSTNCENKTESIENQIGANTVENIKSHSNLNVRMIMIATGLGGIVISLIALLERVWTKTSSIITLLEGIAKHLGVSP